jgi:hypothetical protein
LDAAAPQPDARADSDLVNQAATSFREMQSLTSMDRREVAMIRIRAYI